MPCAAKFVAPSQSLPLRLTKPAFWLKVPVFCQPMRKSVAVSDRFVGVTVELPKV